MLSQQIELVNESNKSNKSNECKSFIPCKYLLLFNSLFSF